MEILLQQMAVMLIVVEMRQAIIVLAVTQIQHLPVLKFAVMEY